MFGTIFESFHAASTQLMAKIKSALPEGSTTCRIRATSRESHRPTTGTLLETLGEETQGMVFLDPVGMPLKYAWRCAAPERGTGAARWARSGKESRAQNSAWVQRRTNCKCTKISWGPPHAA